MDARARQVVVRVLVVVAALLLVLALLAGYVRLVAIDSDEFANRATAALRDDSVKALLAERVTAEVLTEQPDLLAARPIIESVASSIVGSRAFTGLFRVAVRDVHRALFQRDEDTVTLTVADVGTVLAAALQRLDPKLADEVGATRKVELVRSDIGDLSAELAQLADDISLLAVLLLAASVLLGAGAIILSRDRRRTVVELGACVAAGGVVLVVAYSVVRAIAVGHVDEPQEQAAAGAVWDAFLRDLRTASWILAGSGAVVAAAAASVLKPVDIRPALRRAAALVTEEPRRPALRVLRAGAFLAAGLLVILAPAAVLNLLLTLLGVFLIYEAVLAILRLVYRPRAEEEAPAPAAAPARPRRRLVPALVAAAIVVATISIFVGTGGTTTAAPSDGPCNGHAELCERRLDDVALPATHNAMSVPLPGWYSAEQERPIADQLADGIRGLLIDTHYADKLPNGKLRTDLGSQSEEAQQDGVSPQAVAAAERLRDRLGFSGEGERGMYLCHSFCELGGTPLGSVLDDIHDFLVANPNEVLVIINQDYVTPEDFVGAVRDAGLEELAYSPAAGERWPTLRDLIERGKRVVFLAENHAGGAPWYQLAYERVTEETPFRFTSVPLLNDPANLPASCEPNRGPERAPLFLANHWIATDPVPLPSNAAKVNAYDKLLARMRHCARQRDHSVNLVAVNFYREGDLFRVVDELNGVR